jgi:triacylglycerol lipase
LNFVDSLIFSAFDCNPDLEETMNLVFASGFLVPQHLLGINYFRGLEARLKGSRHKAIFPDVPPLKTSVARATKLAKAIDKEFPEGEIHIIAHSMGGLDSRTLIGLDLNGLSTPGRIASLTTLSTPHGGSPVADLLTGSKPGGVLGALAFEAVRHALGLLSIPTGALEDLTTEGAKRIPDVARTHAHIRYRSHFAAGRKGLSPTCLILAPTHHFVHSATGQPNDGVVALDSARYGDFQEPFFPCDHVDLVGHNLDTDDLGKFQIDHFAAIDAMILRAGAASTPSQAQTDLDQIISQAGGTPPLQPPQQ